MKWIKKQLAHWLRNYLEDYIPTVKFIERNSELVTLEKHYELPLDDLTNSKFEQKAYFDYINQTILNDFKELIKNHIESVTVRDELNRTIKIKYRLIVKKKR